MAQKLSQQFPGLFQGEFLQAVLAGEHKTFKLRVDY